MRKINVILIAVCKFYEIKPEELFMRTRKRNVVQIRYVFFYLAHELSNASLESIGEIPKNYSIKYYDHATVRHGKKLIENLLERDKELQAQIKTLKDLIKSINIDREIKLPELKLTLIKLAYESKDVESLKKSISMYSESL